jgi:hypothetical protein
VEGAAEVTQDTLEGCQVGFSGIVHVEANLLNCIGDIRSGEIEVL